METTSHRSHLRVLVVGLSYVVMVGTNALANILPINGQSTGAVSDRFESMFTPAGFTFSIWGVIYLGLLMFVVVQALPRFRRGDEVSAALARMDGLFIANALLNAGWILAWHYNQLVLSMIIMLGLLATLLRMHRVAQEPYGFLWRHAVLMPISVYFAWICMATIANASVLQSAFGLNDALIPETVWTLGKILLAVCVAAFVYLRHRNAAFVAVVAWAAYGIQANQPDGTLVQTAAMVCAMLCVATVGVHIVGRILGKEAFTPVQSRTTYE